MNLLAAAASSLIASSVLAAEPPVPPPPAAAMATLAQDPAAYMAAVARQPGVVVTDSGLAYKVMHAGSVTGAHPRLGDQVRVSYEGRLIDGAVFDSSKAAGGPVTLTVGQLVPGWDEALMIMRPGDDWTLYVPPTLGYGDQAAGPIPANSVMIFRLQLLSIVPPAAG